MKLIIVVLALAAVVSCRPEEDHYDSRYDDFDVEALTSNKRLMQSSAYCINDKGKCTRDVEYFKKRLPEGIQNDCEKCTDKQKVIVAKIIKAIMEQLPEEFDLMYNRFSDATHDKDRLNKYLNQYA